MDRESLRQVIFDNQERLGGRGLIARSLRMDHEFLRQTGKIAAIVGPRRAGKSCCSQQVPGELGVPAEKTTWLDFSVWPLDSFEPEHDWQTLFSLAVELSGEMAPLIRNFSLLT